MGRQWTDLMEGTLMPIFLQKDLLSFWLFFPQLFSVFKVLLHSLLLWQCASSLNLLAFLLTGDLGFLVSFDSCKFSKPPCIELTQRIKAIRVVDVDEFVFFFLFKNIETSSIIDVTLSLTLKELPSNAFSHQIMTLFPPLLCFCLLLSDRFFSIFG